MLLSRPGIQFVFPSCVHQAKFQLRTKGWQGLDVVTEPCNVRMRMDSTFVPAANQRHHKVNLCLSVCLSVSSLP